MAGAVNSRSWRPPAGISTAVSTSVVGPRRSAPSIAVTRNAVPARAKRCVVLSVLINRSRTGTPASTGSTLASGSARPARVWTGTVMSSPAVGPGRTSSTP
ncbi:hypothetical protein NKG94_15095 [Micromonospora sp. M12]